jgi:DNA-binding GntR family transcriptional regulator
MASNTGFDDKSLMVRREATTIRQQATDILRQAIVDQRFPPGKHLVERELCNLLGVSRTSVREALRHLESEDLIRTVPHKGPVVTALTAEEARKLYEVRAALEGLAGELFAKNATDDLIEQLAEVARDMDAAARQPNPEAVLNIKTRFYAVVFAGAGNDILARMINSLSSRVALLRRISLTSPNRGEKMMQEVQRIIDAAKARDPEGMRDACVAHVISASLTVLPKLREAEEAQNAPMDG